jgi:hypothetical protein
MGRVARIVKWLLALGALALFAVAACAYWDASRIRDVMANGAETTALVDGGKAGVRQINDDTYTVDLAWQDQTGAERTTKGLAVVAALGRQLVAGEAGDPPTLLIKYTADAPGRAPVIVRQAALDQEANGRKIALGAIGSALCAIGFAVLALLGRRSQQGS